MKTKIMLKVNAFAAILNMILNLIFLYIFRNVVVTAITTMISYFVVFLYAYRVVNPLWKIDWNYKIIMKSISASLAMVVILMFAKIKLANVTDYQIILRISHIILGIIIYFAMIFALGVFSKKEINYLKKVFVSGH